MSKENNQLIFYSTPQGNVKVEVIFESENFWLSQKRMAELFGVDVRTVNEHLKNIFDTGELQRDSTIRNFRIVQIEGNRSVSRDVDFYLLDAILAVGYRVNSSEATQFRIWATKTLKEFITKGFVLDDERLKQGKHFGKDYFDELLERIREIRASERRFYQKITDLYALSADYTKEAATTQDFFASVQNKLSRKLSGGNYRKNSSRNYLHRSRCKENLHGFENMETSTTRKNFEKRCFSCEKLFERSTH
jgi:hypothetical protein